MYGFVLLSQGEYFQRWTKLNIFTTSLQTLVLIYYKALLFPAIGAQTPHDRVFGFNADQDSGLSLCILHVVVGRSAGCLPV